MSNAWRGLRRALPKSATRYSRAPSGRCAYGTITSQYAAPLDFLVPALHLPRALAPAPPRIPLRGFKTSIPRCISASKNPLRDESGEEMTIEISPRASHRLGQIMKEDGKPNLALRITVESGGCHGFQYLMSLTEEATEDETLFEAQDGSGAKVVMDEPSLELLRGSKVDYTMELIGSQFKITDNPHATSSCGCGTSFDIA